MSNPTLKQLRYFDALARLGHFGRAAEFCAISQPALSMQIKELEEHLGATLIERGPRHMRLSALGEDVTPRVHEILRLVDELGDIARASKERLSGRLRIGVIPTVGPYLLPALTARLTAQYDGLDLRIREALTPQLIRDLHDGRLDTALVALPVSEPAFEEVALFDEAFVLVRPRADAAKPVPGPEALREMQLLLLDEGHCFRDQALSFCGIEAIRARTLLDGNSLSTLVQMVGAGIGVTLIPEMAIAVETSAAPVAITHFPGPPPSRRIGMVWRKASPLARQLAAISQDLRGAARAHLGKG